MAPEKRKKVIDKDLIEKYPVWTRQAIAYRLLHILLPKQLTKRLPKMLSLPFIGPGVSIPPGFEFPGGAIIPPGFEFPAGMTYEQFLSMYYGFFLPKWITALEGGVLPPGFIDPFGPGPPSGKGGAGGQGFNIGILQYELGIGDASFNFGDANARTKYAGKLLGHPTCKVRCIKIQIGKAGSPTDDVYLELRSNGGDDKPSALITGGTSSTISSGLLGTVGSGSLYLPFNFYDSPGITIGTTYWITLCRSGSPDASNYFQWRGHMEELIFGYFQDNLGVWDDGTARSLGFKLYGIV